MKIISKNVFNAIQFTGENFYDVRNFIDKSKGVYTDCKYDETTGVITINRGCTISCTISGKITINKNDYVIIDRFGYIFNCDSKHFNAKWQPVDDNFIEIAFLSVISNIENSDSKDNPGKPPYMDNYRFGPKKHEVNKEWD